MSASIRVAFLIGYALCVAAYAREEEFEREVFPDGVEHWYVRTTDTQSSRFFQIFQDKFEAKVPSETKLPFGKSAALLVGVSSYKYLSPQLPSVTNDLTGIRLFLLSEEGFDDVYLMSGQVVNRDLIEKYVKSVLPKLLGEHGRLLFYFSGHGSDSGGKTGYMQFSEAKEGETWGASVLPINVVNDWSMEVRVKHMLFLLDCCASGLAFSSKLGGEDSERIFLNTLCGGGSRAVLTAGTSDERAYALSVRDASGNGVFTKAFLAAFEHSQSDVGQKGVRTLAEVFAAIQREVTDFGATHGIAAHPRMWPLQDAEFRGTFVFLDPRVKSAKLTEQQAKVLNVPLKAKGSDVDPLAAETGIIQLTSEIAGELYIDGESKGRILKGQTGTYFAQKVGLRHLELRAGKVFIQNVTVQKGEMAEAFFKVRADQIVESPIASDPETLKGSLMLRLDNVNGEVSVDGHKAGYLVENQALLIENLTVGEHVCSIRQKYQILSLPFLVEAGKTTQIVERPPAPMNLRAL